MFNIILKFLTFGRFYLGKKRDILIFNAAASNFLSLYFESKEFNFFYSRREKFEIISFIITLFKDGFKNFGRNYFFNYLKIYKPKFIFSMWIYNKNLYYVKNNFPNIKVIIVQGNRINNEDYELLSSYPSNCFDLFFTFREKDKDNLKKIFNTNSIISIGSIKNNHYFENKDKFKNKLLFFSEFKDKITYDEKIILKNLDKYCGINNLKFDIQHRHKDIPKNYLTFLKKNKIFNKDKILKRNDDSSAYKNANNYHTLVASNSTLNDEFISNYRRVVTLSSHEDFDDKKYFELNCGKRRHYNFDNPMFKEMLPKNFSWTANLNEKNIFTVLDNVIKCDQKNWTEHIDKYRNRFLYDQNNKIFVNKLIEIGIGSKLKNNFLVKKN